MVNLQSVLFVFSATFCMIFQGGWALHCFECNSHYDPECSQDIPPDAMKKDCASLHSNGTKYNMCRKITQIIEFEVNGLPPDSRVIRSCGWVDYNYKGRCYQRSGFGGRQEVCSCLTDFCNGVATPGVSIVSALFLPTIVTLFTAAKIFNV